MNKKIIISIISLMIVCLGINLINFPVANAVSYYNWILGSDMETATNYIEDSGFESGVFNSGVLYGNWSGTAVFDNVLSHSGVYSLKLTTSTAIYTLVDVILGADIESFRFYSNSPVGSPVVTSYITYSDGSSTDIGYSGSAGWSLIDVIDDIDDAKYVASFNFSISGASGLYLDDFFLGVVDEYSQEQYDFDTYPWRTTGLLGYWQSIGYVDNPTLLPFLNFRTYPTGAYVDVDMIGHNLVWGRNSNGSGYIGGDEWNAQFIQDINYLDSDSVHFIDLWAYTPSVASVGVKINIIYSDRSFDTKTIMISEVSTWEHLNFGASWIDDNKYIVQIQISLGSQPESLVNIDDVGIWSSLPANSYRFTYTVSPTPITQTPISFNVYMGQTYTFTGYLYDINGELTENGTVTVAHNFGSTTATLSLGIFSFTISPRTGSVNGFTEQFGISVNTGETVELYELTVNWVYTSGSGLDDDDEERATNLIDWLVMFMVIFLPALLLAGGIYENNQQPDSMHISPIFGIIAGLCLSIGIGVYTALVPVWILVLIIVAVVVLIVGMVKH